MSAKTPRRWLQFSLRTLFVAVALLALFIGHWAERARRQREALEAIADLGARVKFDWQALESDAFFVSELSTSGDGGPHWLQQWIGREYFETPVGIYLELTWRDIARDELRWLKALSQLQTLNLDSEHVTNSALEPVGQLKSLKVLCLDGANVDQDGLQHITTLTQLEYLRLGGDKVTDPCLVHVGRLTHLRTLHMFCPNVTDAGLAHLEGLTELEELSLFSSPVTDAGLQHLRKMKKLRTLDLRGTRVSEAGVERLRRELPDLQGVSFWGDRT
jgi:hypothetical protein